MADFLTTQGTSYNLENIIINATKWLVLISPYLNITENFLQRLQDADRRKVKIIIVYGKDELKPDEKDHVLEKRCYSGFFETGLDLLLRDLKVDTVIITGLHTHICCRHTAADAFFRGYKIIIPRDGVEAFTAKDHEEGLEYLKNIYDAEIKTVDEIIKDFK